MVRRSRLRRRVLFPTVGLPAVAIGVAMLSDRVVKAGDLGWGPEELVARLWTSIPGGLSGEDRSAEPRQTDAPAHKLEETGLLWPAKGVMTSGYGMRWGRPHRGIDIANDIGTPIVAAADAEVVFAGWNEGGYGNLVELRHRDGTLTRYAHTSRILVRAGESVRRGQGIALMGDTGRSTAPHLHFEIVPPGGQAINPMQLLRQPS